MKSGDIFCLSSRSVLGGMKESFFRVLVMDCDVVLAEQVVKCDGVFDPYGLATAPLGLFSRFTVAELRHVEVVNYIAISQMESRALAPPDRASLMPGIPWEWGGAGTETRAGCQVAIEGLELQGLAGILLPCRRCYLLPCVASNWSITKHIKRLDADGDGFTAVD